MSRNLTTRALTLAILASVLGLAGQGWAAHFQNLYVFKSPPDATNPYGGVAIDPNGVIYGASLFGGSHNSGTVFTLTPPGADGTTWTEAIIWDFPFNAGPGTGLVRDVSGNLFGTTGFLFGGSIYELSPISGGMWTFSDLWDFGQFGANPQSDLSLVNNALYGTVADRSHGVPGGVFGLTPGDSLRTLYAFKDSPDGAIPLSSLTRAASINGVFGTAFGGGTGKGSSGCGTVYDLTSSGGAIAEDVLYTFQGSVTSGPDGCRPEGSLLNGANGVLYGTTTSGGTNGNGTVYSLTPPATSGGSWTETVLYNFAGGSDGSFPNGRLVSGANGVLYGTTAAGGGSGGDGTIFSLMPPAVSGGAWTETVVHAFSGPDGYDPNQLTLSKGVLYGTTQHGGSSNNGTVFGLLP